MIEINGWAIIRESYNEDDESEELLNSILSMIQAKISEMQVSNEFYCLKTLNGTFHLTIMANHNHKSENVLEFYAWVAAIAPGSYGILYVQDDEDIARGNEGKFKVWCMKKGRIEEQDDVYLSPYLPEVEE